MYEEWKAGKGITKLAYVNIFTFTFFMNLCNANSIFSEKSHSNNIFQTKVNPLPDPKYLVAEKGTVVEVKPFLPYHFPSSRISRFY